MMPGLYNNLAAATKNKHVLWPMVLAIVLEVAPIWTPAKYQGRLAQTEKAVQKLLIAYGVFAAANSGPTKEDGKQV